MNSMFGDLDQSAIPDDMQAADDRTLRLAAPHATSELVEAFLVYQRALAERLETTPLHPEKWDEHLATAHTEAQQASGLSASTIAQLNALSSQFSTRRLTFARLTEKRAALRKGGDMGPEAQELDQKMTEELAKLEPYEPLERRYGKPAIDALRAHEAALLELHARVALLLSHKR